MAPFENVRVFKNVRVFNKKQKKRLFESFADKLYVYIWIDIQDSKCIKNPFKHFMFLI